MKNTEFAYAAGYIDGDGCFAIANTLTYHLNVTTIKKENAQWFADRFEGTLSKRDAPDPSRQDVFSFRFNLKGLKYLPDIEYFLVEKKEECAVFRKFADIFLRKDKISLYEEMKRLKYECNLIQESIKDEIENIKNTIIPSEEDFAYLAGFIDAECSLDISKTMHKRGKNPCYRAQLQCNNTKSPFFFWCAKRFGGQFHFLNKSNIPKRRNQMLWRISCAQLLPILQGVYPFLNSKKEICKNMIKLQESTYTREGAPSPRHPRYEEFYAPIFHLREEIYLKVRHLN